jgi:tetratricopeptide (TPR) repeat protein
LEIGMSIDENAMPDPEEVKQELERIRKSKRFRRVGRAFELLEYLVNGLLEGTEFSQEQVAADVYKKKGDDWSAIIDSDARTGRNHLQRYLAEYYEKEGSKDPLIIEVPLGSMYRANCSLNPLYLASEKYLEGSIKLEELFMTCGRDVESRLGRPSPVDPEAEFERALQADPEFAPALAARAEARLIRLLLWSDRPIELLANAERDADSACGADLRYWPGWVIHGAIYCCRSEWKKASACFKYVEENAPAEARETLWFILFLLANGQKAKALKLSKTRLAKDLARGGKALGHSNSWMISGFVHYLARRHDEAERCLNEALRIVSGLARENWFAMFLLACVYLAKGQPEKALGLLERSGKVWFVQGFLVSCLVSNGEQKQAKRLMSGFSLYPGSLWIPPMQTAIAQMAVGEELSRVIGSLESAYANHDPWVMLLGCWPIFDPLRKKKEFKTLLKKVRQPKREWWERGEE